MPDSGFEALVTSVNQNIRDLQEDFDEIHTSLVAVEAKLDRLPDDFIPRKEANEKAGIIRRWFGGVILAGVVVAGTTGVFYYDDVNDERRLIQNCRENRASLREVILLAMDGTNPLRDRLLALEGTQPSGC